MLSVAKHLTKICWPALLTGMLFLSACENDLKKVQELAANQLNMNVDTIHGVDVIFSDSAKVKFRLTSPLLLQYNGKKPHKLMPKTIQLLVYENMVQTGVITADTGIMDDITNNIQFRKNVVAKNDRGDVFKSDELIWDKTTKTIHSTKLVHITSADGNVMNGTSFESDDKLHHWTAQQSYGLFNVTDAPTQ
jgi:LPS export ABC transporter protein LptC